MVLENKRWVIDDFLAMYENDERRLFPMDFRCARAGNGWDKYLTERASRYGSGRGRDGHCWPPPAEIRTSAFTHTALMKDEWRRSVHRGRDAGLEGMGSIFRRREQVAPTFCGRVDCGGPERFATVG